MLLGAQGVQPAAGPPLFELGREIEVRARGVARADVPFEHAALRDDAQIRVGRRERNLPPRLRGAQIGDHAVVLRLGAPGPVRGGDNRHVDRQG